MGVESLNLSILHFKCEWILLWLFMNENPVVGSIYVFLLDKDPMASTVNAFLLMDVAFLVLLV